jgi:hypothetical protein
VTAFPETQQQAADAGLTQDSRDVEEEAVDL